MRQRKLAMTMNFNHMVLPGPWLGGFQQCLHPGFSSLGLEELFLLATQSRNFLYFVLFVVLEK